MAAEEPGAVTGLQFFIFGQPVTMSPSPEIHNTGFAKSGFPHNYSRFDTPTIEGVLQRLHEDDCGGGSVTIPHKEAILAKLDTLSDAAAAIGAVNTVTKGEGGKLHGDNTDWLGIKNQLQDRLRARVGKASDAAAESPEGVQQLVCLICGAGGTARAAAYALKQMEASRVLIYNRTTVRAEALAGEFGFEVCSDFAALGSLEELHIVVNTLPGASEFVLPDPTILQRCRPVVLEAAYIPRRTAFVAQALAAGCEIIEGIEMLFEQGCAQCEIWTKLPAPRSAIAAELLRALFTPGSNHPAFLRMEPYDQLPGALQRESGSSAMDDGK
mmetsp:Transcript_10004/g.19278  ORF Transcript_10004/g.19278 Transcript_10004/m.19278 type:complete len:327 (-) Transcript_10004:263-1243(-)